VVPGALPGVIQGRIGRSERPAHEPGDPDKR
jgi:hypothetical protein